MLDSNRPLFKLAKLVDWAMFEQSFSPLYCQDNGRPAKPIRLMVGLLILKHLRNVSDETVVEQFTENAYYQYLCGMDSFSIKAPCVPTEHVEFRRRIGEAGIELILKESIRINFVLEDRKKEAEDRGYRGQEQCGDASVMIPSVPKRTDSQYTKSKMHELFRKRAGIEPVIGHCKSDHRLGRNFYKGLFGDSINVMLAAAAFNFKRAMRALLCLIDGVLLEWIGTFLRLMNQPLILDFSRYADMRARRLAF